MRVLWVIALSAAMHALAFPPYNLTAAAWVALIPFLVTVYGLRPRAAFGAGLLWGSAAIWGVAHWVPRALTFYYQQPWWFGVLFCVLGSMLLWGWYYAVFAVGASWLAARTRGLLRAALVSALWVSCELARARLLTGEPWMLLGYALMPSVTLIQAADIGGVYLLSFLVVFVNASLAEALLLVRTPTGKEGLEKYKIAPLDTPPKEGGYFQGTATGWKPVPQVGPASSRSGPLVHHSRAAPVGYSGRTVLSAIYQAFFRSSRVGPIFSGAVSRDYLRKSTLSRALVPAALLLVAFLAYGHLRLSTPLPETPEVPVTIVQGNNDLGSQWQSEFYGIGLEQYLRTSLAAAARTHPRVLIWPENAVTFFLAHEPQYQKLMAQMLRDTGAELIVGAPHYEDTDPARPRFYNSAFYMTAGGQLTGRYDKAHLLPFGEYFPLRFIELLRRHFERVRTFTPGDGAVLLDTRLGKTAVVICFEAIFPDLVRRQMARGAGVLVNLSNDVWLGNTGAAQHLAMVRLRAVENRTWVIRAATTGISAIIDPRGRVRTHSETNTLAVLDWPVVPLQVDTLYKRYGDVFAATCVFAALASIAALAARHPPRR